MSSKTVAETSGAESGFQGSDDNFAVNLSGIDVYKSVGTTIDISTTDLGSVGRSFQLVDDFIGEALDFIEDEAESNRILLGGAGSALLAEAENNRIFAGNVIDRAFDETEYNRLFSAGVVDKAFEENDNNRLFAAQAIEQNAAASAAANDQAFAFAGQATTKAIDTISASTEKAFDFIGQGYTTALGALASDTAASYDFINTNQDRTFTLYNKVVDESGNLLNGLTSFTKDLLTDQSKTNAATISAVSEATRSDATQSFDKLVKWAALAFGAVALGSVAVRNWA